jgi:stage IV sporulation protein FB
MGASFMFLAEPAPTRFDLHFSMARIPVRIHPFFWLGALLLGANQYVEFRDAVVWVSVVLVSILVHEFGHAFAFRYYGWDAHVVLHGIGGLAVPEGRIRQRGRYGRANETLSQVLIAFAGPAAGFLLAGIVLAAVRLSGQRVGFVWDIVPVRYEGFGQEGLDDVVSNLLIVNIVWGLLNLCPVFPLDGGRIARELLVLQDPHGGERNSFKLSIAVAVGLAILAGMYWGDMFLAFFFGYFAFINYQALQALSGGYGGGRGW